MLQLQLRRLDLFCTVVDEGGVTRAAERLHAAQPWVSAQLRTLEKATGAPLFLRDGRRLALTEAGRRFHSWAADVLASSAQVRRGIENLGAGLAGSLTVATSMAIGTHQNSPEGREFIRRSAAAWGKAHLAAGGEPEHVAAAVEATTKFYAPDPA